MDLRFDVLFAGFSAVKGALYSPASSSPTSMNIGDDEMVVGLEIRVDFGCFILAAAESKS